MLRNCKDYGEGSGKRVALLLPADHLERDGVIACSRRGEWGEDDAQGEILWDQMDLVEAALPITPLADPTTMFDVGWADAEAKVNAAWDSLFGHLLDELCLDRGDYPMYLVQLEGTIEGLDAVFDELLLSLSDPMSGEDDSFDYWPSGMRTAARMAFDLDRAAHELGLEGTKDRDAAGRETGSGEVGTKRRDRLDRVWAKVSSEFDARCAEQAEKDREAGFENAVPMTTENDVLSYDTLATLMGQ